MRYIVVLPDGSRLIADGGVALDRLLATKEVGRYQPCQLQIGFTHEDRLPATWRADHTVYVTSLKR